MKSKLSFVLALLILISFQSCTDVPLSDNFTILNNAAIGFWQDTDDKVVQIFSGNDGRAVLREFIYNTSTEKFDLLDDLPAFFTDLTFGGKKHQFISIKNKIGKKGEESSGYQTYEYLLNSNSLVLDEINTSIPSYNHTKEGEFDLFKTSANFQNYVIANYTNSKFFIKTLNYEKKSNTALRKPIQTISSSNPTITSNTSQEANYYSNELNRIMKKDLFYTDIKYVDGTIHNLEIERNQTGSVTLVRAKMFYKQYDVKKEGSVELMYDNGFAYLLRPSFDEYFHMPGSEKDFTLEQRIRMGSLWEEYKIKNKAKYEQKSREILTLVITSLKQKHTTAYKGKGLVNATYVSTDFSFFNGNRDVEGILSQDGGGSNSGSSGNISQNEVPGWKNITNKTIYILGIRRYKNIMGYISTDEYIFDIAPGQVVRKFQIHPTLDISTLKPDGEAYYFINFK